MAMGPNEEGVFLVPEMLPWPRVMYLHLELLNRPPFSPVRVYFLYSPSSLSVVNSYIAISESLSLSVQSKSGDGFFEIVSRAVVRSGKPDSVRKVRISNLAGSRMVVGLSMLREEWSTNALANETTWWGGSRNHCKAVPSWVGTSATGVRTGDITAETVTNDQLDRPSPSLWMENLGWGSWEAECSQQQGWALDTESFSFAGHSTCLKKYL